MRAKPPNSSQRNHMQRRLRFRLKLNQLFSYFSVNAPSTVISGWNSAPSEQLLLLLCGIRRCCCNLEHPVRLQNNKNKAGLQRKKRRWSQTTLGGADPCRVRRRLRRQTMNIHRTQGCIFTAATAPSLWQRNYLTLAAAVASKASNPKAG